MYKKYEMQEPMAKPLNIPLMQNPNAKPVSTAQPITNRAIRYPELPNNNNLTNRLRRRLAYMQK